MEGLRGRGLGVVGEIYAQLLRRRVLRWTWGTAAEKTGGCTKRVVVVFFVVVVVVVTWVVVVKLLEVNGYTSSSWVSVQRGRKRKKRKVLRFDGHQTKEAGLVLWMFESWNPIFLAVSGESNGESNNHNGGFKARPGCSPRSQFSI